MPRVQSSEKSNPVIDEAKPQKVSRWAAIAGRWKFHAGEAVYGESPLSPAEATLEPSGMGAEFGIALASGTFRDGRIRTVIRLSRCRDTTAGILFGFRNRGERYYVAGLGGFDRGYGILSFDPGVGWRPVTAVGSIANLSESEDYFATLTLAGQSATLTVNGVDVISQHVLPDPLEGAGFGLFAFETAPVVFRETEVSRRQPQVFVVMPFKEPFDTFYNKVIQRVAKAEKFDVKRVDEIQGPGNILEDIRRQIQEAHVIVAEISSPNPNVFYEVGYAHALNKPVILLARRADVDQLPFDLRPYRVIFYDDTIGGKSEVERALKLHLRAVLYDK